jgi:hypothetical protein
MISPAQAKTTQVTMVVKGKLMVQPATGGRLRPATAAQKGAWSKAQRNISATSPNRKYRAVAAGELNDGITRKSFRIIEANSGQETKSAQSIADLKGSLSDQVFFDGWLPDSIHFAVVTHGHISTNEFYSRYIVNAKTGRIIHFNGWLAPNGRTAIVPGKEGLVEDTMLHYFESANNYVRTDGDLKWFAIKMPRQLTRYKVPAARRPIVLDGKALPLTAKALATYEYREGDPVNHAPVVEFSQDGLWAICHSHYYSQKIKKSLPVEFLISISTGKVRKLIGVQAKFI